MKRFIMVLILVTLVFTPTISSAQIGYVPVVPITIIDPIVTDIQIPNLILEINSVAVKAIPLYRLKILSNGLIDHTYTSNATTASYYRMMGWQDDGIVCYVSPIKITGKVALYRCYHPSGLYLLTLYPNDAVLDGYQVQGALGYVNPTSLPEANTQMVYRSTRFNPINTDFLFSTSATLESGYNALVPKFKGWTSAVSLQDIVINPIASSITGNTDLQIKWTSKVGDGFAEILYSTDNGSSYTSIISGRANGYTNSYTWKVPNITSSQVRIMVKWSATSTAPSTAWTRTPVFSITKDSGFSLFIPFIPEFELLNFVPANPSNLTVVPGVTSVKEIRLYWQDNANTETGYKIERKTGAGSFSQIGTTASNAVSFVDSTVVKDTEYTYRIRASGSVTDSGYSEESSGTYVDPGITLIDPDLFPDSPTNLSATVLSGTEKKAQLHWTKPAGTVDGYIIERKTTGVWGQIGATVANLSYTDLSLASSVTEAVYRVKAYRDAFESEPSNEATVVFEAVLDDGLIYDGTQSGWAETEIAEAYESGLTYPVIMSDFQRKITREEFCVISVKLYEKLSGNTALPDVNPFTDTSNNDILKAYGLGIVKGMTADKFAPENNISRQEMCVMIYRALQAAGETTALLGDPAFPYTDKTTIATWAFNEVKFCNQKSIMLGTSATTISPLMNTPREQAIVLVERTYAAFK
jgi:hypothetical protein